MVAGNFAWNRVFSFSQLFCLFWEKQISSEIHVFRSDQFFVINILLFTSVVCYCQNGKCSLCNKWWHSFMNQRLNHLVLLYKFNSIRIMFLNTYNKNVDIIWHYCIISHIKLHGFWKRSALTTMKKDPLKYMINRLWYDIIFWWSTGTFSFILLKVFQQVMFWARVMVFNATFNNISVISWH